MTQKTITERDIFLAAFEREYPTTLKVLRAYPADKSELKPAEKSRTARELAWMLVLNQIVLPLTLEGKLDPASFPPAPATMAEVIAALEREHQKTLSKISSLTDEQMNRTMPFMVGPGKMADVRTGDALWMFVNDTIHHRGQFSVYMRMAGGKLPSIYGPTADEPWR
jgi:uncharacterized damage-inducible protein DinB